MYITEITYIGDPETHAKEFLPIVTEAMEAEAQRWHREDLPEHFTPAAVARYGYAKVTKGYAIRKGRRMGHQNPMVFTGEMKQALTRSFRLTSLKSRADVRLRMWARAVNLWPDGAGRKHNFPLYLTSQTQAEIQAAALRIQDRTARELQRRSWSPRTVRP